MMVNLRFMETQANSCLFVSPEIRKVELLQHLRNETRKVHMQKRIKIGVR